MRENNTIERSERTRERKRSDVGKRKGRKTIIEFFHNYRREKAPKLSKSRSKFWTFSTSFRRRFLASKKVATTIKAILRGTQCDFFKCDI